MAVERRTICEENDMEEEESEVSKESAIAREWELFLSYKQPKFVLLLSLLQYLFYAVTVGNNEFGGVVDHLVFSGDKWYQPWRYFTVVFVHRNVNHILGNTLRQVQFGILLEIRKGWKCFALVYFVGAAGGTLFHLLCFPNAIGISSGASSATKALLFANLPQIVLLLRHLRFEPFSFSRVLNLTYSVTLLIYIVRVFIVEIYCFCTTFSYQHQLAYESVSGEPSLVTHQLVSHAGHLGGMLSGIVIGILVSHSNSSFVSSVDADNKSVITKETISLWNHHFESTFVPFITLILIIIAYCLM